MRALAALALAAGPALADDKPSDTLVIPLKDGPVRVEVHENHEGGPTPPTRLPNSPTTGALAFGGGWAIGQIIVPPPHPDSAAPPRGMVFEPPEIGDPMAIEPGGAGLGSGWKPRSYTGKFAQGLADTITKAFQLVVPKNL